MDNIDSKKVNRIFLMERQLMVHAMSWILIKVSRISLTEMDFLDCLQVSSSHKRVFSHRRKRSIKPRSSLPLNKKSLSELKGDQKLTSLVCTSALK